MEPIEWLETNQDENLCRICGYDFGSPARLANGYCDYCACPCCYAEAGCHDNTLVAIRAYRQKWLDEGGKWHSDWSFKEPPNWDREAQMKNIPPEFL